MINHRVWVFLCCVRLHEVSAPVVMSFAEWKMRKNIVQKSYSLVFVTSLLLENNFKEITAMTENGVKGAFNDEKSPACK